MKIYGSIRTVIYLALTALVLAFVPALAEIEVLRYFIGGLMIYYGVEEIIYTAFKHEKHYHLSSLYWNIIEILIGLTLIVFIETGEINVTYAVVCISWAIWTILREADELVEATTELKEHKIIFCKIVAVLDILESLTVIALSLTMIIEPGEHHAKIHLYLLAVELATKVLFPIIIYIAEYVKQKRQLKIKDTGSEEVAEEVAVTDDMGYIRHLRKKVGHETIIMPCACVIIGDGKGNVLLQQRRDDGKWGHHGGAIEMDESSVEAAKREVKEELNLDLDEMQLLGVYSGKKYHHTYPNGDETSCIDIVYVCHKYHGDLSNTDGEVKRAEWFNKDNIPSNLNENPKDAIRDYFKKYFDVDLNI